MWLSGVHDCLAFYIICRSFSQCQKQIWTGKKSKNSDRKKKLEKSSQFISKSWINWNKSWQFSENHKNVFCGICQKEKLKCSANLITLWIECKININKCFHWLTIIRMAISPGCYFSHDHYDCASSICSVLRIAKSKNIQPLAPVVCSDKSECRLPIVMGAYLIRFANPRNNFVSAILKYSNTLRWCMRFAIGINDAI